MAEVSLRPAVAADAGAIAGLYNALLPTTTYTYRDAPVIPDEMAVWLAEQQSAGYPVVVAARGPDVIGYATFGVFRGGRVAAGYARTAELTIHVDRVYQSAGIGRRLMEALVVAARDGGIHVLVAAIDASNTPSIAFHERLGFTEVGRMPEVGRKFGRWLTLVLMQRIVE